MISLLLVNYRSAALAATAIRTAREACSQPMQVVVVDNSNDASEAHAVRSHADVLIVSDRNRGYAGGINLGRTACTGETIVVTNPDVVFAPRAIDLLLEALRDASVAGPKFFWDESQQWMLPPGDLSTAPEKLDEILASRSPVWAVERDRRRFRKRVAFWSEGEVRGTRMLSGAVMAIRAKDFDLVDGFDERFPLYFEESDFLRRLHAIRRRVVYVPAAHCRHLFNQSAAQVADEASARYALSEMRYLEKWNGPFLARLLKKIERPLRPPVAQPLRLPLHLDRDHVVIEVSPLANFATAAGHFPRSRVIDIPAEIVASLRADLFLRVVQQRTGDVLGTYRITG